MESLSRRPEEGKRAHSGEGLASTQVFMLVKLRTSALEAREGSA